jgi:hypothetical protein
MTDPKIRLTGLYAMIAAGGAVLVSPLLALSYFATESGAKYLTGTVSAWAHPARDLVGGLLTWAAPERVYATYLQMLAALVPALFLCARIVRARRPTAAGQLERWGWRATLAGYGLFSVGLIAGSIVAVDESAAAEEGSQAYQVLDIAYLAVLVPGMAISAIGSTVLGIALLRNRYQPRTTAVLLTLAFPSMLVIPDVLGHNSLGLLPLFLAWGVTGLQLWHQGRSGDAQPAGTPDPSDHSAEKPGEARPHPTV